LAEIIGASPGKPHREEIYWALLSATAKAILLQAEVEVTAKAETATPLAQVTINLASTLQGFGEIFMAKLTQRCGGWVTPIMIPSKDVDGKPWPDKESRMKAAGIRKDGGESDGAYEDASQFGTRVTGMMRVYFNILTGSHPQPLHKLMQMGMYWTWFARLANEPKLLEDPTCPMIIYGEYSSFLFFFYAPRLSPHCMMNQLPSNCIRTPISTEETRTCTCATIGVVNKLAMRRFHPLHEFPLILDLHPSISFHSHDHVSHP
jgi:hypothetical protein